MLSKIIRGDGITELASIKSVVFHESVNSGEDLRPGCVASAYIEVVCYGSQSSAPDAGEALTYYQVDPEGNDTLIGVFFAEPAVSSRNTYTVIAYDSALKLNADFSTWLASHQNSFPLTIGALVSQACTIAGVTLTGTFAHSSISVDAFYVEGITCRQIFQWASEIAGCFVRADTSGNLYFGWYTPVMGKRIYPNSGTSPDQEEYIAYKQDGLRYENYNVKKVSAVAIQPSGVEGAAYIYPTSVTQVYATDPNNDGNVILHNLIATDDGNAGVSISGDFDAYDTSGLGDIDIDDMDTTENPMIISGNVLLSSADPGDMMDVAETIYDAMRAVPAYRPFTVDLFTAENPFRAGDIVAVEDIQGVSFHSPVMEYVLTDSAATLSASGNETRSEYVKDVEHKLVQLSSDIVKINKLKVDWAEIDTAVINVLQANGIDADWINAGALTVLDSLNNIIFKADKDTKTVSVGSFNASRFGFGHTASDSGGVATMTLYPAQDTSFIDQLSFSRFDTNMEMLQEFDVFGYANKGELHYSKHLRNPITQELTIKQYHIVFDSNGISLAYGDNRTNLLRLNENGVVLGFPNYWKSSLGLTYESGDSVTFGTLSYTQFSGGCRTNNAFNFTIPLAKPVASDVTASVSGSIVIYGDGHYRSFSMDDSSIDSLITSIDGSGVTVHIVFDSSSVPAWYSAQTVFGIQAYNLTVSFA